MSQLVIRVKGEIEASNFEEWKAPFVAQIRSLNTELTTDADFVEAQDVVKRLKAGEKLLRDTKQETLDQSSDLQQLFRAIDEVAEEARRTRLTLERQIKTRKQDIKNDAIQQGVEKARRLVQAQSEDFQRIDSSDFLDRARFRDAIKGKAGLKGVEKGIHTLLERIEKEIQHKALEVQRNAATLATLSADQQLLFQDRGTLLDFTESKLAEVIEGRLAKLVAEHEVSAAGPSQSPERVVEPSSTAATEAPEHFRITLELQCSKSSAVEIARSIREGFGHRGGVGEIRLSRGN